MYSQCADSSSSIFSQSMEVRLHINYTYLAPGSLPRMPDSPTTGLLTPVRIKAPGS